MVRDVGSRRCRQGSRPVRLSVDRGLPQGQGRGGDGAGQAVFDLARFVHRFSATFAAWRQRLINSDQAGLLGHAAAKLPDKFPDAETVLLEIVGDDPSGTRKVLDYWTSVADRDEIGVNAQLARRFLDYRRTDSGMVEGEFSLPSMAGETFVTAIDALTPPAADGDGRSPRQRRADALEDLARTFLDRADVPGRRLVPHIDVHIDLRALRVGDSRFHETTTPCSPSGRSLNSDVTQP